MEQNHINEKAEDIKGLIKWHKKLLKRINIITIPLFVISTITTIILFAVFYMNFLPISILVNQVLSIAVSSFLVSAALGGVIFTTNAILLTSKQILKLYYKKLNQKKTISQNVNQRTYISKEKTKSSSKVATQNNYSYNYQSNYTYNNIPTNSIMGNNFIMIDNNPKNVKKKIRLKK